MFFPLCLPGGDNLDIFECEAVLGQLSACRQSEVMESGLEPTPGAREPWVQARSRERPLLSGFSPCPTQNAAGMDSQPLQAAVNGGLCTTTPLSKASAGETEQ